MWHVSVCVCAVAIKNYSEECFTKHLVSRLLVGGDESNHHAWQRKCLQIHTTNGVQHTTTNLAMCFYMLAECDRKNLHTHKHTLAHFKQWQCRWSLFRLHIDHSEHFLAIIAIGHRAYYCCTQSKYGADPFKVFCTLFDWFERMRNQDTPAQCIVLHTKSYKTEIRLGNTRRMRARALTSNWYEIEKTLETTGPGTLQTICIEHNNNVFSLMPIWWAKHCFEAFAGFVVRLPALF